jgi:hypothetical protein
MHEQALVPGLDCPIVTCPWIVRRSLDLGGILVETQTVPDTGQTFTICQVIKREVIRDTRGKQWSFDWSAAMYKSIA